MLRSIKSPQRLPRQLHFKVDGTGTASIVIGSKDATLTDDGTGLYTLTFAEPFARPPVVVCTNISAAVRLFRVVSATATACQIAVFDASGVDQDADFFCVVQGFDAADEY